MRRPAAAQVRKLVQKYNRDLITLEIGFNDIDSKTVNAIRAACDKNKEVIAAGAFARNCPGPPGAVLKAASALSTAINRIAMVLLHGRAGRLSGRTRRLPARAVKKGGAKVGAAEAKRLLASTAAGSAVIKCPRPSARAQRYIRS